MIPRRDLLAPEDALHGIYSQQVAERLDPMTERGAHRLAFVMDRRSEVAKPPRFVLKGSEMARVRDVCDRWICLDQ